MIGELCHCCGVEPIGDRDGIWCEGCSITRHDCPGHRYVAAGRWPDLPSLTYAEVAARRASGVPA
jgi:hypothetical protein